MIHNHNQFSSEIPCISTSFCFSCFSSCFSFCFNSIIIWKRFLLAFLVSDCNSKCLWLIFRSSTYELTILSSIAFVKPVRIRVNPLSCSNIFSSFALTGDGPDDDEIGLEGSFKSIFFFSFSLVFSDFFWSF